MRASLFCLQRASSATADSASACNRQLSNVRRSVNKRVSIRIGPPSTEGGPRSSDYTRATYPYGWYVVNCAYSRTPDGSDSVGITSLGTFSHRALPNYAHWQSARFAATPGDYTYECRDTNMNLFLTHWGCSGGRDRIDSQTAANWRERGGPPPNHRTGRPHPLHPPD